ncbi:MAG TPA: hypothetical protein VFN22_02805 [Gemmatimonadales bacterium]|nr:hypothetical protein [Gemmatimonadales bacterium]
MTSTTRRLAIAVGMLTLACTNPPVASLIPPPPPPVPRFTLALREGGVQRISQGEVLALTLLATREPGFDDPITFSATTPPGVVLVFRPPMILSREDSEIRVVVDTSAARTRHRITLRGTDPAGATRDVVLELTVDEGR